MTTATSQSPFCEPIKLRTHLELFSIFDTIRTSAESSGIWVFSFKYFECAVLFPYIVKKQTVPTW